VNMSTGLVNVCYQNSLLQALFMTDQLRSALLRAPLSPLPEARFAALAGKGSAATTPCAAAVAVRWRVHSITTDSWLLPARANLLTAEPEDDVEARWIEAEPATPAPGCSATPEGDSQQSFASATHAGQTDPAAQAVTNRLQWLMARLALSQRPAHATSALQAALPPEFTTGAQHDVSEFHHYLAHAVDTAMAGPDYGRALAGAEAARGEAGPTTTASTAQAGAPFTRLFGGSFASIRVCRGKCQPAAPERAADEGDTCGAASVKLDSFTQLTLQLPSRHGAITGICAVVAQRPAAGIPDVAVPEGYARVEGFGGVPSGGGDVNKDRAGSPLICLAVTRERMGRCYDPGAPEQAVPLAPITDVRLIVQPRPMVVLGHLPVGQPAAMSVLSLPATGAVNPATLDSWPPPSLDGWTVLPVDLNTPGAVSVVRGDRVHLALRRDPSGSPITDIRLVDASANEPVPSGYARLPDNLNSGGGGATLHLCVRRDLPIRQVALGAGTPAAPPLAGAACVAVKHSLRNDAALALASGEPRWLPQSGLRSHAAPLATHLFYSDGGEGLPITDLLAIPARLPHAAAEWPYRGVARARGDAAQTQASTGALGGPGSANSSKSSGAGFFRAGAKLLARRLGKGEHASSGSASSATSAGNLSGSGSAKAPTPVGTSTAARVTLPSQPLMPTSNPASRRPSTASDAAAASAVRAHATAPVEWPVTPTCRAPPEPEATGVDDDAASQASSMDDNASVVTTGSTTAGAVAGPAVPPGPADDLAVALAAGFELLTAADDPVAGHHLLVRRGHGCPLTALDVFRAPDAVPAFQGWETIDLHPPPPGSAAPGSRGTEAGARPAGPRMPRLRGVWLAPSSTHHFSHTRLGITGTRHSDRVYVVSGQYGTDVQFRAGAISGLLVRTSVSSALLAAAAVADEATQLATPVDTTTATAGGIGFFGAHVGTWSLVGTWKDTAGARWMPLTLTFTVDLPAPVIRQDGASAGMAGSAAVAARAPTLVIVCTGTAHDGSPAPRAVVGPRMRDGYVLPGRVIDVAVLRGDEPVPAGFERLDTSRQRPAGGAPISGAGSARVGTGSGTTAGGGIDPQLPALVSHTGNLRAGVVQAAAPSSGATPAVLSPPTELYLAVRRERRMFACHGMPVPGQADPAVLPDPAAMPVTDVALVMRRNNDKAFVPPDGYTLVETTPGGASANLWQGMTSGSAKGASLFVAIKRATLDSYSSAAAAVTDIDVLWTGGDKPEAPLQVSRCPCNYQFANMETPRYMHAH
jgi:hypothetical protein